MVFWARSEIIGFAVIQCHGYWSTGAMEYWSFEKKDINPLAITPPLQYSNTPKIIEIESPHHGLPYFGL